MNDIEWEQVESPEYIEYCEANNHGYCIGVSKCRSWTMQKVFCSDDVNDKSFTSHLWSTYNPFEDKRQFPDPYSITSENGTYVDPITKRRIFLNSMPQGLFIPLGRIDTNSELPKFNVKWNPNQEEDERS